LENGEHRFSKYPMLRLQGLQERLLEIWGGDVTPDEAVDMISRYEETSGNSEG
jgi:hypothetical protein